MQESTNEVVSLLIDRRLVTPRVLERYLEKTPTQVKNELRRLRSRDVVESFPFVGKQVYYRLTESACRRFGVSRRFAGAPGPQAIRQYYGLLHFACCGRPPRHFLTEEDWESLVTDLCPSDVNTLMPRGSLYLDVHDDEQEQTVRLGVAIVDGRAEPASLLKKAREFVVEHRSCGTLRQLIAQDEFLFAFITESDGKADAIADAAERASFNEPIRLHVAPDLSQI